MAKICPVCDKKIGFLDVQLVQVGIEVHTSCTSTFLANPEEYGGEPIEKTEAQTRNEDDLIRAKKKYQEKQQTNEDDVIRVEKQYQEKQQKNEENSVHVKSFDMPFGDMVMFMVKWAIASIPAFIILAIISAILVAIFGALFF